MTELWKAAGAAAWGAASLGGLQFFLSPDQKKALAERCPGAAWVLVAAFPYFAGNAPGNLSLYCRGEDYHQVLLRRLSAVCDALKDRHPGYAFVPGADSSPVPELAAARLAGVGLTGKNGLRIVPPYGTYVFLGTILTDRPPDGPVDPGSSPCPPGCRACLDACPTGALTERGCDQTRCLSALTQKKGALTPREADWIRQSSLIWGCDQCQTACPYNHAPAVTPLPEFREDLCARLTKAQLEGLSNKAFRRDYAHRAFAWRGIAPLLRNLSLQEEAPLAHSPQEE